MYTKAKGEITGEVQGGWLADFTHPRRLTGVVLPKSALCHTRVSEQSRDSRVRITDLPRPDLDIQPRTRVVAIVASAHPHETGKDQLNPAAGVLIDDVPPLIPEVAVGDDQIVRWGLDLRA